MKKDANTFLQRPPLYQQAVEALRSRIIGMRAGDCLPSEKLLSSEYGIGLATIRESLRILASEGRVERKQGKGTFVATPKDGVIAITIDQDVSDPRTSSIYLQIAQEVRGRLEEEGLSSRLFIGRNIPIEAKTDFLCPEFFKELEEGKIRGIIGVLLYGKAAWIRSLDDKKIPLVGFGIDKPYHVDLDIKAFYRSAIAELKKRGKHRIALLCWGGFENGRSLHGDVFQKALTEAGLPVVKPWIKDDVYSVLEGSGWSGFREIWSAQAQRPDGLVITDDFFLAGVVAATNKMGIMIPQQLEIAVCLSNRPSQLYPCPLITWQPDIPACAAALVNLEISLLKGQIPTPAGNIILLRRTPEFDNSFKPTMATRTFTAALV